MSDTNVGRKKILPIIKRIIISLVVFPLLAAVSLLMSEAAVDIFRLATSGIFPFSHIVGNLFGILSGVCLFLLYLKYVFFYNKWEKLTYAMIAKIMLIFLAAMLFIMAGRDIELESYEYVNYPDYIEQMPTQSVRINRHCVYPDPESTDKIKICGYLSFINNFNGISNVKIVEDSSFTDSIRMEVFYKGDVKEVELYDYDSSGKNTLEYRISIYDDSYSSELSIDDYIYMYKNQVNVSYADNYAVEKIVLYTAYPELIDISGIECR